ncbi:MAG: hypothetical protein V3T98_02560, partial [Candidatus Paceibacterota bacterium]
MKVAILGSSGFAGEKLLKILAKHPEVEIIHIYNEAEIIFFALPPEQSTKLIPGFLERGIKIIDLSSAYRLNNTAVYGLSEK